jgi:nucleoid-associated protein YgaU
MKTHQPSQDSSGTAATGAHASAPRSRPSAKRLHRENSVYMQRVIDSGKSITPDPLAGADSFANLYKNAAEWIDMGEAVLSVLSPTHDSAARGAAPSEIAYFDKSVDFRSTGADYDDGNLADPRVDIADQNVIGGMDNGGVELTLYNPKAMGDALVVQTLIHECQHDADQHTHGSTWEHTPGAGAATPAWVYNSFLSEFRAYWTESPEGNAADRFPVSSAAPNQSNYSIAAITNIGPDGAELTGDDVVAFGTITMANARQEAILVHMGITERPVGDWWDFAANDWRTDSVYGHVFYCMAADPAFLQFVQNNALPQLGNRINSVRIQALSTALEGSDVSAVFSAADALEDLDKVYLSDRTQSAGIWSQAAAKLNGADFVRFEEAVTNVASGPYRGSIIVQRGDTLSRIAIRTLGDAGRWREIYDMNKSAIGSNPDFIRAGMQLYLPST